MKIRSNYAWAKDAAGNVSPPQSTTVVIALTDTTPPSVSITSPAIGITAKGTVAVSVAASDDVAVAKVELYINGALYATDTAAPYTFNWDSSLFRNGIYSLSAKAYDAANNVQTSGDVSLIVNRKPNAPTNLR